MNQDLEDEITSINSIYDEATLTATANTESKESSAATVCALRLPSLPSITLRLAFPADYPDAPPSVLGTQSVVDVVREVLARVYRPGEPCVFDVLDDVGAMVERERAAMQEQEENGLTSSSHEHHHHHSGNEHGGAEDAPPTTQMTTTRAEELGPPPAWALSEPLTEKKSVFLGRAAACTGGVDEAKRCIAHLLATDKKAARATHNITAWRIRGRAGAQYQDCDDDGEAAAGGRLLHLLQLMDAWDVVVVVTRWYGGVQLGPDRFRLINQAARDAVVAGGFVREEKKEGGGGGKKKGKR
ncbi:hypothetical protein SLS58_003584 [Diplodia intermedia]|uniref:RWD domain-containing protein n=1 Tax=Diplodia intermedia TaxID=856260 RepID=A0ABR3TVP6_9PEZI